MRIASAFKKNQATFWIFIWMKFTLHLSSHSVTEDGKLDSAWDKGVVESRELGLGSTFSSWVACVEPQCRPDDPQPGPCSPGPASAIPPSLSPQHRCSRLVLNNESLLPYISILSLLPAGSILPTDANRKYPQIYQMSLREAESLSLELLI